MIDSIQGDTVHAIKFNLSPLALLEFLGLAPETTVACMDCPPPGVQVIIQHPALPLVASGAVIPFTSVTEAKELIEDLKQEIANARIR